MDIISIMAICMLNLLGVFKAVSDGLVRFHVSILMEGVGQIQS
jgi:hypothetical protein